MNPLSVLFTLLATVRASEIPKPLFLIVLFLACSRDPADNFFNHLLVPCASFDVQRLLHSREC